MHTFSRHVTYVKENLKKSHKHIINRLVTCLQSFELIVCAPLEELITQIYYLESVYVENVGIYVFVCKKSHAQAGNIYTKFQTDCLKTLVGVNYTIMLPRIEALPQNLSKMTYCFQQNIYFICD